MKASLGKKVLSGLLTATLVLSMSAPALAAKKSTPTKVQPTSTLKTSNVKKGQNKIPPIVKEVPKTAPANTKPKPSQENRREILRSEQAKTAQRKYATDKVIVKFKSGLGIKDLGSDASGLNLQLDKKLGFTGAQLMKIGNGKSVEEVIRTLKKSKAIEYVQPDYILYPSDFTVTDPLYSNEWGLKNVGQTINGMIGTPGIDIHAEQAWPTTQGSDAVVVAVIDTGIDYNHPDLADRMWHNPVEVAGNGIDDDGDGYIDDVYGYDFYNNTGNVYNPYDGDVHGTHVAGTIAASANTTGVIGVAPNVKIMSLKFLGPNGGYSSDAIRALDYAKSKGVKLANNSWGGVAPEDNYALENAIANSGILFVAAAGNEYSNNDVTPAYPASYPENNIVSVAALDNTGNKAFFSNYGYNSVDVAAPGVNVFSTVPKKMATAAGLEVSGTASPIGAPYKAIVQGFGLQEFASDTTKTDIMTKAMNYLGITTTDSILLVDDQDSSSGYFNNYLTAYQTALTGYNVTTITVTSDSAGPDLTTLSSYRAVIWFTGDSFGNLQLPLTSTDTANLSGYLNNGGNLFLSGPDVLYGNEESGLVADMLHTVVVNDGDNRTTINGQPITAYVGATYTLDSNLSPYNDQLWSNDYNSATPNLTWPADADYSTAYTYMSGTSMATPHVTGTAALIMSAHPDYTIYEVKTSLMATSTFLPSLNGLVSTSGIINAGAAVKYSPDDDIPGVDFYRFPEGTIVGTLDQDNDLDDVYRIYLNTGEKIQATMHSPGNDFDLYIYGPQSNTVKTSEGMVAASENIGNSDEIITFTAPKYGVYYLDAYGYAGTGQYTLDVVIGNQAGTYENDNPALNYFGNGSGGPSPLALPKTVPNSSPYSSPTVSPTPTPTPTPTSTSSSTSSSTSTSTTLPTAVPILPSDTWSTVSDPSASGGSYAWTNSPYSGVEFEFNGSGIRYNAMKNPEQGIAKIWVDGYNYTADLYSTTPSAGTVFEKLDLYNGMHYIVIEWSGMASRLGRKTNTKINLDSLEVISDTTPPAKPTGLTGTLDVNNHANLTWNPNTESDLGGYVVLRGDGTNPTSWYWINSGPTFPDKTTSYVDTTVTIDPSIPYSYKVIALDKAYNESEPSNILTLPDARPTNVQATVSNGNVQLTWTASPLQTVTGYQVYRGNQGPGKTQITTTPVIDTNYTDPGLAPGTYWYEVRSVLANGDLSMNSQEVNVTITEAPLAPTGLTAMVQNGDSVQLTWSASTSANVVGYNVYRSTTSGSGYAIVTPSPISSNTYTNAPPSSGTYYYIVTAVTSSQESGYSNEVAVTVTNSNATTTRYEETDSIVQYPAGTWGTTDSDSFSGGKYKYSDSVGATATLTFIGTGISWVAAKSPKQGLADVYIDNVKVTTTPINLYSSSTLFKQVVYESLNLGATNAQHTIKIVSLGTKGDPTATGTRINVDAFDVTQIISYTKTLYEESDTLVQYPTGIWGTTDSDSFSGGKYKYSDSVGATATLTFIGTGISWVAAKSPKQGLADVYIDNVKVTTTPISLYSSSTLFKQVVYESLNLGATNAQHTIKIVSLGTKGDPTATGTRINVDAFEVTNRN